MRPFCFERTFFSMSEDDHELRSYGRRRGRKPSARQASLLRNLLPQVTFQQAVASEGARIWFEIGFGGGEHLVTQAQRNPSVDFIGCEPYEDGVIKVLDAIERLGLGNIRIHMGDARDALRCLEAASVEKVFILFPDPWPKRKQRKRRLVNRALLDLLARIIKPGGELRVATDIDDYARTLLEAFVREPRFAWQAQTARDWRVRPPDWPETRYEAKAALAGRRRYYFRFLRL